MAKAVDRKIVRPKPSIQRTKNGRINRHYSCFGFRGVPKSSSLLGNHAFKTNISNDISDKIQSELANLAEMMESTTMNFIVERKEEYKMF